MVTRKNIGGYRLVSLGFLDLALISTATACEGLAPALASKSKKRVVLTDIVVSGEPKNDVGVEVEKISGGYAIKNVYGYDLEIVTSGSTLKATPSADHITASEIDSETATAGQALLADGDGGASFGNIEVGASQIDSGSATSGQVLTADGSGGVTWSNIESLPYLNINASDNTNATSLQDVLDKLMEVATNGIALCKLKYYQTSPFSSNREIYAIINWSENNISFFKLDYPNIIVYSGSTGGFDALVQNTIGGTGKGIVSLPIYPDDASSKTYVPKLVNGNLEWVEETPTN